MRKIALLLILALMFTLIGCDKVQTETPPKTDPPVIIEKSEDELLLEKVDEMMSEMTLDEKIAQMLIIQYSGYTVSDKLLEEIKTVQPGGFILFANNISTYDNTKVFVETLQENSKIPMIMSIDQEGGKVQRMSELAEATYIPDMNALGSTKDYGLAQEVGAVMAKEMRTIGVNTVFAPVVDILSAKSKTVLGTRSFGSSAELVSNMAKSVAFGLEQNGVIATYKHFPGLGDTSTDSHKSLPVLNKTLDELKAKELVPYENAIKNGAKIIMVGHVAVPNVTGDNTPASLSKVIVTDILREQMGYNGLVVTDALNMGAITNNYTQEEMYIKAVNAGCDLLLMPNDSKKAIETIRENISEERINQSVKRILFFKLKYLADYEMLDKSYLGCEEHKAVIDKIKN